MKKLIATVLCIIMLFSMAIPALAAGSEDGAQVISEENLEFVINEVVAEFVEADEDAEIIIENSDELTEKFDIDGDNKVTDKEISINFADYLFVDYNKVDAISDKIVEEAELYVHVLDDGTETVYIGIDLVKHPELFNLDVIRETVKKLVVKQDEYYAEHGKEDAESNLLSYQHMAGEIAAHVVAFILYDYLGGQDPENQYHSQFKSAKYIELTINEDRFPVSLINFMGKIIMDFISVTFFDVFNAM